MNDKELVLKLLDLGAKAYKAGKENYADPQEDSDIQGVSVATIANWLEELGKLRLIGNVEPRFSGGKSMLIFQLSAEGAEVYTDKTRLNKRIGELFSHHDRQVIEKYDVFLSYSTQDSAIANELRKTIEKKGFSCFMAEKDIPVASQWSDEIRNAIKLSKRVLLLITPRSKDRPWILLETGAAWALQKDLIPALMFVTPSELVEPIREKQVRIIETIDQRNALVHEIISIGSINQAKINGCWIDRADGDTVFFQQRGNRVVGIYDYDGRKSKVGFYLGIIKGRSFEYEWRWYNGEFQGHGRMMILEDNKTLSGLWWYGDDESSPEHVGYERIDDKMPGWLTEKDFNEIWILHMKTDEEQRIHEEDLS